MNDEHKRLWKRRTKVSSPDISRTVLLFSHSAVSFISERFWRKFLVFKSLKADTWLEKWVKSFHQTIKIQSLFIMCHIFNCFVIVLQTNQKVACNERSFVHRRLLIAAFWLSCVILVVWCNYQSRQKHKFLISVDEWRNWNACTSKSNNKSKASNSAMIFFCLLTLTTCLE